LLDDTLNDAVETRQQTWRNVVGDAIRGGLPVPGMASGLAYFDSLRTADLPQNLTQAQRDAFGSHTYQRKDAGIDSPFIHTDWLD
ncbi:MAG: NADP-dependent phosphogluconate dehydrogenase, partial [Myxococcota bacterium]